MIRHLWNSPQGGVLSKVSSITGDRTQYRSALAWVKTPTPVAALAIVRLASIVTCPGQVAFDCGNAARLTKLATRDSKPAC